MGEAFLWGAVAASSLVVGALIALRVAIGTRTLGIVTALGAGLLIGAVAYELVLEAFEGTDGDAGAVAGLFAGALTFFVGDQLIDRMGGQERKAMAGSGEGTALAIAAIASFVGGVFAIREAGGDSASVTGAITQTIRISSARTFAASVIPIPRVMPPTICAIRARTIAGIAPQRNAAERSHQGSFS